MSPLQSHCSRAGSSSCFQSDSLLNVLTWSKHWLASDRVLEPSQQVWTALFQLRQPHTLFSLFFRFACPVGAGRQNCGERRSTEPPGSDCEEPQQLTHSILTSCNTQRLQALGKRAKVLDNYHFMLLVRRSWSIYVGGLWYLRRAWFVIYMRQNLN